MHLQNVQKTELTSCNTVAKDTFQSRCSSVDEQKCVWQKCGHWTSVCCLHESLTFTGAHERAAHIRNWCDPAKLSKILLKLFFIKYANSSVGLIRKTTRAFPGSSLSVLNKSNVCDDVTATSLYEPFKETFFSFIRWFLK